MSPTDNSSSYFQSAFDAALSDYAKETGVDLTTHPFAHTLENCDSVDRILDVLEEKAQQFRAYRDGNRKLIDCLKPIIQVLRDVSGILGEAALIVSEPSQVAILFSRYYFQLPFQPTKAILVGVDVLLNVSHYLPQLYSCNILVPFQASMGISASYDALIDLFECVGSFLNRLRIYTEIPFSPLISGIIIKIMAEVLSVLSLATKQIKQGRLSESHRILSIYLVYDVASEKLAKKLLGESEIEDVLHRLDRLTLDEARMTGTETLQVVHGLVGNMKLVLGGE